MLTNQHEMHAPSAKLLGFLDTAQAVVGERFLVSDFRRYLAELHSIPALNAIENDKEHPLWWFLPPILYDMFDDKLTFSWLEQLDTSRSSLMVVPPPFVNVVDRLRSETAKMGISTTIEERCYSRCFLGLLYGGYPWFASYLRLVQAKDLIGLPCTILKATSETCDVPGTLENFKKRNRDSFGQSLQMAFDDLPYPGVLRPFHAPARIETQRHRLAAEISE